MFTFKEYNPLKRTFTRVQSEDSTSSPSTPESRHVRTPEVPKPPSLPSSAIRHASNALLTIGGYVSNAFQQVTASMSRSPRRPQPLSFNDNEPLSPSGLTFSSPSSVHSRESMLYNREITPTPLNHQMALISRQMAPNLQTISLGQTTLDNGALESDNRDFHNIHDDESDDASISVQMQPKRRGRKVNSTFMNPPQGDLPHPDIDWIVDKLSMEKYMHDYAKQEGFAVNALKERGGVIRWRCAHSGKYNDHRNLPVDVTDKTRRRELAERGEFS
jgi:hypothetical protein